MNFKAASCPLCGSEEAVPLLQLLSQRMVRCQRCGLIYRNPRPTAKDLTLAYAVSQTALLREERVGERRSHQLPLVYTSTPAPFPRFFTMPVQQPERLFRPAHTLKEEF